MTPKWVQDSAGEIRYTRMRWKKKRDEGDRRSDAARHQEVMSDRLRDVLSREYDYGDQDPKEVEARLRNMVYGTNRK